MNNFARLTVALISTAFLLLGQRSSGQTKDTVFIKYVRDWTADSLIYTTDTVIFESGMTRNILTGSTILPETHNQRSARAYGLYFNKVTASSCQKDTIEYYSHQDKINYITSTDSTLQVDINIFDNCCYSFLCDISVDSSATLNLIYYGYGNSYCACECCFGLTMHFTKMKGAEYKAIKAVMINGNRKTVKQIKK